MSTSLLTILISTFILLVSTGIVAIYIGKLNKGSDNWFVGGRELPIYVIVGTQFATAQGGGMLVAQVGIGYLAGWSAITYVGLVAIGFIFLIIMADWLRRKNFSTLTEVIENIYGANKVLLILSAIIIAFFPFGWIATQLVALASIFSSITGIAEAMIMIVFAAVSLVFILPAGLKSVAWTDFIFGCVMIFIMISSVIFALNLAGGWSNMANSVPLENIQFPEGLTAIGLGTIMLWAFANMPGPVINQMYYQRIFSIKDASKARLSLIVTAIVIILSSVWAAVMGMSIRAANPTLENEEMAMGWFIEQVPIWFLAIFSAFVIAVILSTVSSAVQSIVTNISKDIYHKYLNKNASDNNILLFSRIISVITLSVAVIMALAYPQALGWLVATYAYVASGLFMPIFVGFLLKKKNFLTHYGAIGGILIGIFSAAIAHIVNTTIPYVVFGLVGSLFGLLLISLITRNKNKLEFDKNFVKEKEEKV